MEPNSKEEATSGFSYTSIVNNKDNIESYFH